MKYSAIYRVMQEEMSIFCAVSVSAILRRQVNINVCLILIGYQGGAV
jgi:hypothetical protein